MCVACSDIRSKVSKSQVFICASMPPTRIIARLRPRRQAVAASQKSRALAFGIAKLKRRNAIMGQRTFGSSKPMPADERAFYARGEAKSKAKPKSKQRFRTDENIRSYVLFVAVFIPPKEARLNIGLGEARITRSTIITCEASCYLQNELAMKRLREPKGFCITKPSKDEIYRTSRTSPRDASCRRRS